MTFGTLAGMMAADAALGRNTPWTRLFDIRRTSLASDDGRERFVPPSDAAPNQMRSAGPEPPAFLAPFATKS
jgi:hypothetical protein